LAALSIKIGDSKDMLDDQAIGNALYGLQQMNSGHDTVRKILAQLCRKLEESTIPFSAQAIGNSLYGLQAMTSNHYVVRRLLVALSRKIAKCPGRLSAQHVGNALYGLQNMSSRHKEVCLLLSVLSRKIRESSDLLLPQNIGNALYGLQNMSSDHEAVRIILNVLCNKIRESRPLLSSQHIGNGLYGLQNMNSGHQEVRSLLDVLGDAIENSGECELSSQEIGNAFYGLQSMSGEHRETVRVVELLANKLSSCPEQLSCQAIANSLFGISQLYVGCNDDGALVNSVATYLLNKVDGIIAAPKNHGPFELLDLWRMCQLFEYTTEGCGMPERLLTVNGKLRDICELGSLGVILTSGSEIERRIARALRDVLITQVPEAKISTNEMLHGFECDVVIRSISPITGDIVVHNIEVDGPTHKRFTSQTFTARRDSYLSEVHSVVITRFDCLQHNYKELASKAYLHSVCSDLLLPYYGNV
jgi:hypothetical protein